VGFAPLVAYRFKKAWNDLAILFWQFLNRVMLVTFVPASGDGFTQLD